MQFLIVNYHYISRKMNQYPGIHHVQPDVFERQLDELGRWFSFVSQQDMLDHIQGKKYLPKRPCLITFDDGFLEQFEEAWPILKRKGIPAIFFVNTHPSITGKVSSVHKLQIVRSATPPGVFFNQVRDAALTLGLEKNFLPSPKVAAAQYRYDSLENAQIKYFLNFMLSDSHRETLINSCFRQIFLDEKVCAQNLYMGKKQWNILARFGSLGSHSHQHVPLANLPFEKAVEDLKESVRILYHATGEKTASLSYPYGGPNALSKETAKAAASAGFKIGLTMERAFNRSMTDPLLLARCDMNDAPLGTNSLVEMTSIGARVKEGFSFGRRQWVED